MLNGQLKISGTVEKVDIDEEDPCPWAQVNNVNFDVEPIAVTCKITIPYVKKEAIIIDGR